MDIYAEVPISIIIFQKGSLKILRSGLRKSRKNITPLASCEELIKMFDAKFAQTRRCGLVKSYKTLSKKNVDVFIYFSASAKLHELEPSAFSAAGMGKLSIKKKAFSEAVS